MINGKQPILDLPPQEPVDLLASLDDSQRVLLVGPSNSGKTSLLQWIIKRRETTSKTIVIDPHAWPGKWPVGCVVVGMGRDYEAIDNALNALVRLMTKRYDEIGKGIVKEMGHNKITIIIDEWRAIVANVGNPASEAIKALLTESRKAAFSVFVATHSDRAKPLGLEGEYDLKDGFAIVRLSIVGGNRQATIDTGDGDVLARLPGPFPTGQGAGYDTGPDWLDLNPEPNQTEAAILTLYDQGESYNEIARQVYGHTGGKQVSQIRQVIERFN